MNSCYPATHSRLVHRPEPVAVGLPTRNFCCHRAIVQAPGGERQVAIQQYRTLLACHQFGLLGEHCSVKAPDGLGTPLATFPSASARAASGSYRANRPSTSPALALSTKKRAKSYGSRAGSYCNRAPSLILCPVLR